VAWLNRTTQATEVPRREDAPYPGCFARAGGGGWGGGVGGGRGGGGQVKGKAAGPLIGRDNAFRAKGLRTKAAMRVGSGGQRGAWRNGGGFSVKGGEQRVTCCERRRGNGVVHRGPG